MDIFKYERCLCYSHVLHSPPILTFFLSISLGYIFVSHLLLLSPKPRGVEPYDPPTTVLVQRNEPQGVSTILSSTDFFQSEQNRRLILEQVDSFQLRDKYMFATTTRVRRPLCSSDW